MDCNSKKMKYTLLLEQKQNTRKQQLTFLKQKQKQELDSLQSKVTSLENAQGLLSWFNSTLGLGVGGIGLVCATISTIFSNTRATSPSEPQENQADKGTSQKKGAAE